MIIVCEVYLIAHKALFMKTLSTSVLFSFVLTAFCSSVSAIEITHELGTTTVGDDPERVIVLEFSFIDALAAVDVAPVGIADDNHRDRVVSEYIDIIGDDWQSVGTRKTPNIEIIASLAPDLIIADTKRHSAINSQLSKIAPTIFFDSLAGDYHDSLAAMPKIAKALGKTEEMDERLAEHADIMAAYKEEFSQTGNFKAQFAVANATGLYLHSPASYNGSLLKYLGFNNAMPESVEETYVNTSLEQLAEVNPELFLVGKYVDDSFVDGLKNEGLFKSIDAIKNDRYFEVRAHYWSRLRGIIAAESTAADLRDIMSEIN